MNAQSKIQILKRLLYAPWRRLGLVFVPRLHQVRKCNGFSTGKFWQRTHSSFLGSEDSKANAGRPVQMPGRVRARASRLLMWNHNSFEMRPSLAPSETCQKPLFHPCVAFQQLFTYPVHTTWILLHIGLISIMNDSFFLFLGFHCTLGWDTVNVSENSGNAAALPALPLITPLLINDDLILG